MSFQKRTPKTLVRSALEGERKESFVLNVRLPLHTHDELKAVALKRGTDISKLAREAIESLLAKEKGRVPIEQRLEDTQRTLQEVKELIAELHRVSLTPQ